ncbi:MAG: peptide-methionine (S)-S-oxide reductase MsrA [Bacteroidetes bacterium]|nr:peptide-methionine (S)-S-oxide reductase MsrA [Bacteroidota bacterium]
MKQILYPLFTLLLGSTFTACGQNSAADSSNSKNSTTQNNMSANSVLDTATFGAGCFWCVEAQFEMLNGVVSVTSGFSGGTVKNPSYPEVCTGTTGHAEVCNIVYDTTKISYDELLSAFWECHDPTQLNRQGNDEGTQYRSVIFYHNEQQKTKAEYYKNKMNEKNTWGSPVVTEISPFTVFYKAEDYHQDYYANNGNAGYCQYVIKPKVEKFREVFADKLKK